MLLIRVSKLFSVKRQILNILGFVGHMFSIATLTSVLEVQKQP